MNEGSGFEPCQVGDYKFCSTLQRSRFASAITRRLIEVVTRKTIKTNAYSHKQSIMISWRRVRPSQIETSQTVNAGIGTDVLNRKNYRTCRTSYRTSQLQLKDINDSFTNLHKFFQKDLQRKDPDQRLYKLEF